MMFAEAWSLFLLSGCVCKGSCKDLKCFCFLLLKITLTPVLLWKWSVHGDGVNLAGLKEHFESFVWECSVSKAEKMRCLCLSRFCFDAQSRREIGVYIRSVLKQVIFSSNLLPDALISAPISHTYTHKWQSSTAVPVLLQASKNTLNNCFFLHCDFFSGPITFRIT